MRNVPVGDIAELNLTDMQVDLAFGLDFENKIQLVNCTTCLQPIRGTRFDCVYCANPRSSICFKCMGDVVMKCGQHSNHHFEIINPIKKPCSDMRILQCCLTSTGAIGVHNIANTLHAPDLTTAPPLTGHQNRLYSSQENSAK